MAKDINIGGRLHSIATGNVVAGTDEILDDNLGKKQTQINTETYNLVESINNALAGLSPDQQEALGVAVKANANEAKLGYYVCDTDADVAAKTIAATGYVLGTGGNIRIKMTNANTADAVTLNINNTGAKALFYNGTQASSTNSWEAGEIVEVYYDGTQFQCQANKGEAKDISYDNTKSGLPSTNVQDVIDETVIFYDIKLINKTFNDNGTWRTTTSTSRYTKINKGSKIRIVANSESISTFAFVANEPDATTSLEFISNVETYFLLHKGGSFVFVVEEDCYLIWFNTTGVNPVDISPQAIYVGEIDILTSITTKNVIDNNTKILSKASVLQESMIGRTIDSGTWNRRYLGASSYIKVYKGSNIKLVAGEKGCSFAFISSKPLLSEPFEYANDTSKNMGIKAGATYNSEIREDCYLIWNSYQYTSSTMWDYNPTTIEINGVSKNDDDLQSSFVKISAGYNKLNKETANLVKDAVSYYHKGASQKTFTKPICLLTAGQSNAVGIVPYDDMPSDIKESQPIANCQIVSNSESGDFVPLNITGKWGFDLVTYYNIAKSMEFHVIKWAVSGSSIDPLGATNYHWTADYEELSGNQTSLLKNFESSIRNHASSNFDIRAMLWHQGEGDMYNGAADRYYTNLRNMIAYIRGVVGNARLPIITGTISHNSIEYSSIVERAQYRIASEDPYFHLIDMSGASLVDPYHFDAQSAIYFGEMVFNALIDYGVINATKLTPVRPW